MSYTVQPITDFTIFTTPDHERKGVQFRAEWPATERDLLRELKLLEATAILEIAVQPRHVRVDGTLRADVPKSLPHPGVRLSIESEIHGMMSYTCDTYKARWSGQMADWQANLRAIVLTLEALRAVDRYGATQGEQYAGFKELTATPSGMGHEAAWQLITAAAGQDPGTSLDAKVLYRTARASAHPDRNGGDRTKWDQVEAAGRALGLAS